MESRSQWYRWPFLLALPLLLTIATFHVSLALADLMKPDYLLLFIFFMLLPVLVATFAAVFATHELLPDSSELVHDVIIGLESAVSFVVWGLLFMTFYVGWTTPSR